MDVATRKRLISSNLDGPAAKVQATAIQEPPSSFSDILFLNILNALNITEPSQRLAFIDDMIARLQWLKQYHQTYESSAKKPPPSDKSPMGSPRQPEQHKPMDHQQMKRCIEKDRDMLQNMSKLIGLAAQGPPMLPPTPKILAPAPPPPQPKPQTETKKKPILSFDPSGSTSQWGAPSSTALPTISEALAAPAPAPAPVAPPVAALPTTPTAPPKVKKPEKKSQSPPPPPQLPYNPAKHFAHSAEEMILDLQEKQRKLLSYISTAHGGKVTDEVLHDYLRHPYVLLKENGTVRRQQNPFYHLMAHNNQHLKMMPPNPAVIQKPENSKPTTPIPAPPVLLPQVELPMKKDIKKEPSPINEKITPPPQLSLQVPVMQAPAFDPTKPFQMPVTRQCNQWSVVSMALPLRLLCRCYQTPCRCPQQ